MNNKKTFAGFLNGKTPLQAGKISAQLEKRYSYDRGNKPVVTNAADFLAYRILGEGWQPVTKNVNGKTEYRISHENYFFEINKTQYTFAVYAADNFKTLEAYESAVKSEFLKHKENAAEAERAAEAEKERARAERAAAAEFNNSTLEKAKALIGTTIETIARGIYGEIYSHRILQLYIFLQLIDDPRAKKAIADWVNPTNKKTIRFFEKLTGIKLEKSYKARIEQISRLTSKAFTLPVFTKQSYNIDMSQLMLRAWSIYRNLFGEHNFKLSKALKMAWAEFKNPKAVKRNDTIQPVQPEEDLDPLEVVEIKYPEGHMLFELGTMADFYPNSAAGKKILKMCKKSDKDFNTNTVERWALGAKWNLFKAENDLLSAKDRHESEKILKGYQREVDTYRKSVEILTA